MQTSTEIVKNEVQEKFSEIQRSYAEEYPTNDAKNVETVAALKSK